MLKSAVSWYSPTVMLCLVAQSCLTLCDLMDCSWLGSSVHGDSPGKNTGVGSHCLLQGIFPTQRSNLSTVSTSESSSTFELKLHCFWAAPSQWLSTVKIVRSGCPCPSEFLQRGNLCSRTPCWGGWGLVRDALWFEVLLASSPLIFPFRHLQIHKPHALSAASQSLLPGGPKWHKCDSSMLSWHWS